MKFILLMLRHFFVKLTAPFREGYQRTIALSPSENGNSPIQSPPEKPPEPKSSQEAHLRLHQILNTIQPLQQMSYEDFMLGWVAMAYISPGLNPDEAGAEDGGWPPGWQPVAAEAFRRFEIKELTKEEFYPNPY
ncbi:hypothetical protein OAE01_01820 [Akkermansiaceae bacterium]|nr:hypothetical protein [Akkermansiaceae bacterium]MDA7502815.1 hypothetical protein [bacterium]MDA7498578.1 hypothetical protein [Akkermansiaceae bacterium]MDA7500599.1 hypothetical protein [Akkermansiaceae bacterium]MDA7531581.1 hypothetical protein [Akkermansiaceae bacterium]